MSRLQAFSNLPRDFGYQQCNILSQIQGRSRRPSKQPVCSNIGQLIDQGDKFKIIRENCSRAYKRDFIQGRRILFDDTENIPSLANRVYQRKPNLFQKLSQPEPRCSQKEDTQRQQINVFKLQPCQDPVRVRGLEAGDRLRQSLASDLDGLRRSCLTDRPSQRKKVESRVSRSPRGRKQLSQRKREQQQGNILPEKRSMSRRYTNSSQFQLG